MSSNSFCVGFICEIKWRGLYNYWVSLLLLWLNKLALVCSRVSCSCREQRVDLGVEVLVLMAPAEERQPSLLQVKWFFLSPRAWLAALCSLIFTFSFEKLLRVTRALLVRLSPCCSLRVRAAASGMPLLFSPSRSSGEEVQKIIVGRVLPGHFLKITSRKSNNFKTR